MTVIVGTPMNTVSGGPELAHQLCYVLNKNGIAAYMFYYDESGDVQDVETPDVYRKYDTKHIADDSILCHKNTAFVIPETAVPLCMRYPKCKKFLWWMSVDNYLAAYVDDSSFVGDTKVDPLHILEVPGLMHLVQSDYARDFVEHKMHVECSRIKRLSDYLNDEFLNGPQIASAFKQDFIAYNPQKGYEVLKPIIEASPQFKWFPIINMTPVDVGNLLRLAKVYVDFGGHPGKDRIPREAAISGCCVITNKKGSAAYEKDVPIPETYKFEDVDANRDEIIKLIRSILNDYEGHRKNYEGYCEMIRGEKNQFEQDALAIFGESIYGHMNTGGRR